MITEDSTDIAEGPSMIFCLEMLVMLMNLEAITLNTNLEEDTADDDSEVPRPADMTSLLYR